MSDVGIPETFAAYGWEITPEWVERYNSDPWVYNLTNALVNEHRCLLIEQERVFFTAPTHSGLRYCINHSGVVDVDEDLCDMVDPTNPEYWCLECEGFGEIFVDGDDDTALCKACDGDCVTPCAAAPLFYDSAHLGVTRGANHG